MPAEIFIGGGESKKTPHKDKKGPPPREEKKKPHMKKKGPPTREKVIFQWEGERLHLPPPPAGGNG